MTTKCNSIFHVDLAIRANGFIHYILPGLWQGRTNPAFQEFKKSELFIIQTFLFFGGDHAPESFHRFLSIHLNYIYWDSCLLAIPSRSLLLFYPAAAIPSLLLS